MLFWLAHIQPCLVLDFWIKCPTENQLFDCTTFVCKFNCACKCVVPVFWAKVFPLFNYFCRKSNIAVVGTIFNVFSYNMVSNLSSTRQKEDALRVTLQLLQFPLVRYLWTLLSLFPFSRILQ